MIFALIVLVILMLIIFMPVKAVFEIQGRNLSINIILYGVIKIAIKAKTKKVKNKIESTIEAADEKIKKMPRFGVLLKIFDMSKSYLFRFLKHSELELGISIKIGLPEPDKTAVSFGLINCIIYSFEGTLKNIFAKYKGTYNVVPDFKSVRFDFDSEIKLSFRLNHALIFGFKMLLIYLKYKSEFIIKGGENNGRTSNRRANENYNG